MIPPIAGSGSSGYDALGIAQVRLVAHDWGAVIGWQLCIWHPDRVECYVALSVGHPTAYARGPVRQKLMGWYVLFFQWRVSSGA